MTTPPDFSVGQVLTAAQMNAVGLWLVKTDTVGTAVANHTVSSCFNADFDNYRVVISGGTASASGNNLNLQLSGITTAVYSTAGYFMTYGSTTVSGFGPAATTSWLIGFTGANNTAIVCDLINPQKTTPTGMSTLSSDTYNYSFTGQCTAATAATGFTINIAAGTMTGQTIRVYGYRN